MTPQERRSMRREQVERCLSTDMTIKDWCVLNKVAESTLYAWMAKFREEEPELFAKPSTSEWIELSRESITSRTALAKPAVAVAPVIPTHCVEDDTPVCTSSIVVRMRDADIVIPLGCSEVDITGVLRAVASL
ncbi:hypothetical protein [Adlercreutzia sp. ZJ242]|uniref:IS66 family insertion sequence element accessory protein TnpA n=1 Tax=Adlercreutzia sp. ZJ242 TaxID=2709409 RepID=UPI0013EBE35B|nr:hypothetical protein [Adlercreutzia sp. ZJ242]